MHAIAAIRQSANRRRKWLSCHLFSWRIKNSKRKHQTFPDSQAILLARVKRVCSTFSVVAWKLRRHFTLQIRHFSYRWVSCWVQRRNLRRSDVQFVLFRLMQTCKSTSRSITLASNMSRNSDPNGPNVPNRLNNCHAAKLWPAHLHHEDGCPKWVISIRWICRKTDNN